MNMVICFISHSLWETRRRKRGSSSQQPTRQQKEKALEPYLTMVCVLLKAGWREKWKFKCGIEGKQKWANYKKTSVLHRCWVALWGRWMLFSWWASQQREWNDKEEVHSVNDGLTKDATHRLSKCQTGLKMRWNADNTSLTLGARQKKKTSLKSSSWIFTPTKIRSKVLWTSDESFSVCSSPSLGKSSNLTTTVFKSTLVATSTFLCPNLKPKTSTSTHKSKCLCFVSSGLFIWRIFTCQEHIISLGVGHCSNCFLHSTKMRINSLERSTTICHLSLNPTNVLWSENESNSSGYSGSEPQSKNKC